MSCIRGQWGDEGVQSHVAQCSVYIRDYIICALNAHLVIKQATFSSLLDAGRVIDVVKTIFILRQSIHWKAMRQEHVLVSLRSPGKGVTIEVFTESQFSYKTCGACCKLQYGKFPRIKEHLCNSFKSTFLKGIYIEFFVSIVYEWYFLLLWKYYINLPMPSASAFLILFLYVFYLLYLEFILSERNKWEIQI